MGKLWDLYQEWRDGMEFPPSHRQVGIRIGLATSTVTGWEEGLTELPQRSSLWNLHDLTNIPFEDLMQAAIDDAELFSEERAKAASERRADRKGQSQGRAQRQRQDIEGERADDEGPEFGA